MSLTSNYKWRRPVLSVFSAAKFKKMMQSDMCIFENETEPLFNLKPFHLSSVLLDDCLFVLGIENVDNVERSSGLQGYFKDGPLVHLFIRLCDLLMQPADVKYHAIELFDVFITEHILYLRRYVQDKYGSNRKNKLSDGRRRSKGAERTEGEEGEVQRQWKIIVKRVKNQVLLRVLSCIQIASKLVSQPKAMLTIDTMEQVLRKAGFHYGRTSIQKSELRVLDTVGHHSTLPTPVVYVETLLEILGHNDAMINLRALYHVALQVLDLFYLQRKHVYRELFSRTTTTSTVSKDDDEIDLKDKMKKKKKKNEEDSVDLEEEGSNNKLFPVTNDLMFSSTAVVSCAAYLLDPLSYSKLTEQLHSITKIPYDEIMDLTLILVRIALSSPLNPPPPPLLPPPPPSATPNNPLSTSQTQIQIFNF